MIIAVPAEGREPSAKLSTRFARAPWFVLYDSDADRWSVLENLQALDSPQGAGIQAAQMLERHGVQAVITPHCGPKAFRVLQAASIAVYLDSSDEVGQAVKRLVAGELAQASGANVDGHW